MGSPDTRTEKRTPFAATVDFSYTYAEKEGLVCRTSVGIATNMSARGLGFYTYDPIERGHSVIVLSKRLHPGPISAEARWCVRVSERLHKVGLMFSKRLSEPALLTEEVPNEARVEAREELPAQGGAAAATAEDWKAALSDIKRKVETLETSLIEEMLDLTASNEKLAALSVTDDLTGLHNRRHFFERLEAERNLLDRYGHTISLMLLDIDNFKDVNDRYGHLAGDALLREFAEVVKRGLRKGDTFTRYGGEEFAAILPHTSGRAALSAAENIRRAVETAHFRAIEGRKRITVSIGVTEIGREVKDSIEAVKRADQALYGAKRKGKNRVLLWPEGA